jgi:hypothetical protein
LSFARTACRRLARRSHGRECKVCPAALDPRVVESGVGFNVVLSEAGLDPSLTISQRDAKGRIPNHCQTRLALIGSRFQSAKAFAATALT